VSPLWRDEVAIYLAPRKVSLLRLRRGLRPTVVASTDLVVTDGHFGDVRPALARLTEVLVEPTWQDAHARVIVADPWARYGIVPWPNVKLDAEGRLAHARFILTDAFGEGLSDWSVALTDSPPGRAYVACAMPAPLKAELTDVLSIGRLRLVSLQPQLVVAFNAWRHRIPADDAWFVSLDEGSLTAVHMTGGAWDRVHMARLSTQWTLELERLRAFGRLTRGSAGVGRLLVDAPVWMRQVGASTIPDLEWLETEGEVGDSAHALALLHRGYA